MFDDFDDHREKVRNLLFFPHVPISRLAFLRHGESKIMKHEARLQVEHCFVEKFEDHREKVRGFSTFLISFSNLALRVSRSPSSSRSRVLAAWEAILSMGKVEHVGLDN